MIETNDQAVQAIRRHHAALLAGLRKCSEDLLDASADGDSVDQARSAMLDYLADEILPHAEAEETTLYQRGHAIADLTLLLDAMVAEHGRLRALTSDLETQKSPRRAAAIGFTIKELFALHADKENDLLVPRLAREPGVRVQDLLGEMHHLLEG